MARCGSRRPELEPERRGRRARAKHNGIWTTRATLCLLSDGARRTAVDCRWRLSAWRRLNFSASPTKSTRRLDLATRNIRSAPPFIRVLSCCPTLHGRVSASPASSAPASATVCPSAHLLVCSSVRLSGWPLGQATEQTDKRATEARESSATPKCQSATRCLTARGRFNVIERRRRAGQPRADFEAREQSRAAI